MAKLIFKEIKEALADVKKEINSGTLTQSEMKLTELKLNILRDIEITIYEAYYVAQERGRERIQLFMDNNFDYYTVSEKLGTTISSVKSTISQLNKKAVEVVGATTIKLITEGFIEAALTRYKHGNNKFISNTLILNEVMTLIPAPKDNTLTSMSSLKNEIKIMKILTHNQVGKYLKALNEDNLALLRYILEVNDDKYTYEKELLRQYFKGELMSMDNPTKEASLDEVINRLEMSVNNN